MGFCFALQQNKKHRGVQQNIDHKISLFDIVQQPKNIRFGYKYYIFVIYNITNVFQL